jgi:NADH pyrophosphatase NudC (nudix superfamily)
MNDPSALGKALEERARSTQNDETKALYERMMSQMDASSDKVAAAHEKSADRTERMFSQGMQAMSGQQQGAVDVERSAADRMERMSDRAMDQMGNVAATRARSGQGESVATQAGAGKVQICSKCKQKVDSAENFCPNCGNKMY